MHDHAQQMKFSLQNQLHTLQLQSANDIQTKADLETEIQQLMLEAKERMRLKNDFTNNGNAIKNDKKAIANNIDSTILEIEECEVIIIIYELSS